MGQRCWKSSRTMRGHQEDMPAWCETTGHEMVGLEEEHSSSKRIYKAFVKKAK